MTSPTPSTPPEDRERPPQGTRRKGSRRVIRGRSLAAEVSLSAIMAADIDDDWLDTMDPAAHAANIDRMSPYLERPDSGWVDEYPVLGA